MTGLRGHGTGGQGTLRFRTYRQKNWIIINANLTMLQLMMWPGLTLHTTGLSQTQDNRTEWLERGRGTL